MAVYQKPDVTLPVTNMYNESISYDKNGNILALQRNGDLDADFENAGVLEIDNLVYKYDNEKPNLLMKVTDNSFVSLGFKDDTLTDVNDQNDDYKYDENGNMTADENKGIEKIVYNHLNLPTRIFFTNGGIISYLYNAAGQKVQRNVNNTTYSIITDYLDGFQYVNQALNFFPHAEGYVNVEGTNVEEYKFFYVFNYTDHLGNIRVSYGNDPHSKTLKTLEENHYYPFGMQVPNRFASIEDKDYRYGFQGQEKDDEVKGEGNSLNYTFRMHDPRVGRFFAVDPLTAKYPYFSPYQFSGNRLIDMVELEGLEPTASEAAKLCEDVYDSSGEKLEGDWGYDNENNIYLDQTNKENGFSSLVYSRMKDGKKEYAYVTAGTDDTADVLEDIMQPMGYSNQVLYSINNAKALRRVLGKDANITWVGHSLGGLLASANALATGGYAITFNAAGLSDEVKEFYSLNKKAKIEAYVVEGEAVDVMQRIIGLKAEGIIYKIPDFQSILSKIVEESLPTPLKKSYQSIRSIQKHMIGTVIEFLEKMEKAKQK